MPVRTSSLKGTGSVALPRPLELILDALLAQEERTSRMIKAAANKKDMLICRL